MSDNPDYNSLVHDTNTQTKRKSFKRLLKDDEDEDSCEELRVCPVCEELLVRHLAKVLSQGKIILTALYDKMILAMKDADKLKPSYLEMVDSLL